MSEGGGLGSSAQFSLGESHHPQKATSADGETRWNPKWDVTARCKWRQQVNDQGKAQTLPRLPESFPFPLCVRLRVVSFLEVDGVPTAPGTNYHMMCVGERKFAIPMGAELDG